jgi:hypothetical protein
VFALLALPFARDLITLPLGPRPPPIRLRSSASSARPAR